MKLKKNKKKLLTLALVAALPLQTVQAVSTFSSFGTVTYTINSITNPDNPGNVEGLDIEGLFELDASQTFNNHSGDGSVTPFPTTLSSTAVPASTGSSFSQTFQLDGHVTNGSVDTNYMSLIDLQFENNSSNTFDIEVLLSYSLSASATGEKGHTSVTIDYFSEDDNAVEDPNFFGFESVDADVAPLSSNNATFDGSDTIAFTLNSGDFRGLFSEVTIDGSLEASPIPLPSAIWAFSSAIIALMGMRKFKNSTTTID